MLFRSGNSAKRGDLLPIHMGAEHGGGEIRLLVGIEPMPISLQNARQLWEHLRGIGFTVEKNDRLVYTLPAPFA